MQTAKPFVIWTLQRTGGTNLARQLFDRSGLLESARGKTQADNPALRWLQGADNQWKLHEPFNYGEQGRLFGRITSDWVAGHDGESLEKATDEICSLHLPMKHCVEMVPLEVSQALADAAVRQGYRHLFLYRREGVNRLLSLHYAKLSGVWGAQFKKEDLKARIFADPLPASELAAHETHCIGRLQALWDYLAGRGTGAYALAFEEIYGTDDPSAAEDALMPLLGHLGLSRGIEDDRRFVAETVGGGEQGTREEYTAFLGTAELEKALDSVEVFSPDSGLSPLRVEPLFGENDRVRFAAVDVAPALTASRRRFKLEGVVVLNREPAPETGLELVIGGDVRPVNWGIDSPGMGRRFPKSPNAFNARFKVGDVMFGETGNMEIRLNDRAGDILPLFGLRLLGSEA